MNYLIHQKIEQFEKASNLTEKILKTAQCIEFTIYLYATILYSETKAKNVVSNNIVNLILTSFYKKNALTSSWINLLKHSIDLLNIDAKYFDSETGYSIQVIAKKFLPNTSQKEILANPDLRTVLDSFSIIRNKAFAHGISISQETAEFFEKNNFSRFCYKLCEYLEKITNGRILVSENTSILDDGLTQFTFHDYSESIVRTVKIPVNEIEDFENLLSKSLYIYFAGEKKMISTAPFIIHRDNAFCFYSGIDNKSIPNFVDFLNSMNHFTSKKHESSFKDLIQDEIDSLNLKPISIKLKRENNVYHNIPNRLCCMNPA
ncbi:MAG: hypothetical protein R2797_00015 [Gelidibacter sp.]|nr:hypothetical protein [Saprospiraceae bacterium]MCB9341211.1 hypothetical protein [Lewinellaceae bacterium]